MNSFLNICKFVYPGYGPKFDCFLNNFNSVFINNNLNTNFKENDFILVLPSHINFFYEDFKNVNTTFNVVSTCDMPNLIPSNLNNWIKIKKHYKKNNFTFDVYAIQTKDYDLTNFYNHYKDANKIYIRNINDNISFVNSLNVDFVVVVYLNQYLKNLNDIFNNMLKNNYTNYNNIVLSTDFSLPDNLWENIKVSCQIGAGLGNQLFTIATTLAYAWKNNYYCFFKKDTDHISKIHCSEGYFDNVLKNLNYKNIDTSDYNKYYEINNEEVSEIPLTDKNLIIVGYFQSEKYFEDYYDKIYNLFKINVENFYKNKFLNQFLIAVHVRRGDYEGNNWILDISYYLKASNYFCKKYKNAKFIVFTDDEEWCKSKLPWDIHHRGIDYIDMMLMSEFDGLIIANSTFSWWAAYLSKAEVVAPKHWYKGCNSQINRKNWITF